MWDPRENTKGNVAFSLGAMLPSGNDNVMNTVDNLDGKGPFSTLVGLFDPAGFGRLRTCDGWQSFKNLGSVAQLYFNGSYIATPQNTNGVVRSTTAKPLLREVSISDQIPGGGCGCTGPQRSRTVDNSRAEVEGVPARI